MLFTLKVLLNSICLLHIVIDFYFVLCTDATTASDISGDSEAEGEVIDYSAPVVDLHMGKQSARSRGKIHFVDDRMLASMDKCRISDREAMHFTSATLAAVLQKLQEIKPNVKEINVEDFVLNRTSLQTMRKKYRRRQAQQIVDEFKVNH